MAAIVHPLLTLLASLTRQELAQQVTYLKAENAILRSKLPDRITLNNQERRRLIRHGKKLGPRIKDLISIVSYSTFCRWIRNMEDGPTKRPKSKAEGKPVSRYLSSRNKRTVTERVQKKKYNPHLNRHTVHKEVRS